MCPDWHAGFIPVKIPERVFVDIDSIILKVTWKDKGIGLVKRVLGKKKRTKWEESVYLILKFITHLP